MFFWSFKPHRSFLCKPQTSTIMTVLEIILIVATMAIFYFSNRFQFNRRIQPDAEERKSFELTQLPKLAKNLAITFALVGVFLCATIETKVYAQQTTTESKQALDLFFRYSYYDVYQIQKRMPSSADCIKSKTVTSTREGKTETVYDYTPMYRYDADGRRYLEQGVTKREVRTPSTYTESQVYTNTCPTEAFIKGIRSYQNKEGMIVYQDCSYYLEPNETVDLSRQISEYYNPKYRLGYTQYYKNPLPIDSDDYDLYLKLIANKLTGTLPVESNCYRTRIFLNKGDKVSLRAKGAVKVGSFVGYSRPNGIDGFATYNFTSNAKHGALIYQIDFDTDWYPVGEFKTITAHKTGWLRLGVNDNDTGNNEGYYEVEYSINKPLGDATNNNLSFADLLDNTSKSSTNNVSNVDDNKFLIRNYYNTRVFFELSRDKSTWTLYSLAGSSKSDYWYNNQQQSFFRIKALKEKVYKIEAGKKYKIDWNKSEWCFDLFPDGDR
jgi:hypothetical protein